MYIEGATRSGQTLYATLAIENPSNPDTPYRTPFMMALSGTAKLPVRGDTTQGDLVLDWFDGLPEDRKAAFLFDPVEGSTPTPSVSLPDYTMRVRDILIDAGFVFEGVTYQSRATDRENIMGAALMASLAITDGAQPGDYRWSAPAADFEWIALDNSKVKMDAQTVLKLGMAQAARKQQLIFAARAIKDQIDTGNITTVAEIDAAFAAI
jgi:hypothetical protein